MKTILHNCRICGSPMKLRVGDGYDVLADPAKLLPLVACNTCADRHDRINRLEDWIIKACFRLCQEKKLDDSVKAHLRRGLHSATRKYALVHAEMHGLEEMVWEEEFPTSLAENPDQWPLILRKYRQTVADCVARKPRPTPRAPSALSAPAGLPMATAP